jgi:hypothetical protein
MRRKTLIVLLSLGTLVGYGSCAARVAHHRATHGRFADRRAAFERRVSDVCVDAALRARATATPEPR